MGWINLLLRVLRLGPLGLGIAAAIVLAVGFALQVQQNKAQARDHAALLAGRPPVVNIQEFDPVANSNSAREAHIRTQVMMAGGYDLTIEKNIGEDRAFMIPLLATDSDELKVTGVAIWTGPEFDFTYITDGRIGAKADSRGEYGFVTRLNGRVGSLGQWDEIVQDSFDELGLSLPEDPIVIYPYLHGREAALGVNPNNGGTIFGIFSKVGGVIALLALLKLVVRPSDQKEEEAVPCATASVETAPTPTGSDTVAASRADLPLWKQRAMRHEAEQSGFDPMEAVAQHATVAPALLEQEWADDDVIPQPTYDIIRDDTPASAPTASAPTQTDTPAQRGFGLRKLLIFVVGGAFALVLVSVLGGLIGEAFGGERGTPTVSSLQMMAETIADDIVPMRADPNRPFYEVDVSGVARWFVVKGVMALNGDKSSIITLMAIIGTILLTGFLLRYYFAVRRMLGHKISPDIANMGFN